MLVNLVEEYGKESVLGNAFVENLVELDRSNVVYVQFDFHEFWLVSQKYMLSIVIFFLFYI